MIVIGLTGPAGSGKSTTADYLARAYGARVFAFAEPLKHIVQRAFDLHTDQLWGPQWLKDQKDSRYGVSPRWLMQQIGTNGVQSVMGKDFWINHTLQRVRESGARLVVIEDVRFLAEADALVGLRKLSSKPPAEVYLWKLDMPWLQVQTEPQPQPEPEHQSESEWRLIEECHTLTTERKSVDELYLAIDRACAYWGIKPALHSLEAP